MAFTYSGDPSASDLDAVRFQLGDTDSDSYELEDAEITHALTVYDDDTLHACVYLASAVMGKYAGKLDRSVGPITLNYQSAYQRWSELYDKLVMQARYGLDGKGLQPDGTRKLAPAELFGGGETYLGPDDSPLSDNTGEGTGVE